MGAQVSRALIEYLESVVPAENILLEEPMHKHTTFRVGGPAEVFVTVENSKQQVSAGQCLDVLPII